MSGKTGKGAGAGKRSDMDRFHLIEEVFKTVRSLIWALVVIFGLWMFELSVKALAGQSTEVMVNLVMRAFMDARIAISLSLAGLTTAWALCERKLRQRTIRRLTARVQERELMDDPGRISSGLTPTGKTNPRDKGAR